MSRRSSREPKQNSWYKLEEEDAGSSNSLSSRASPRGSPVPSLLTKPFAFPALTPATTDGAEASPQFPPSSHAPDGTRLRRPMNSFLLYSNETRPKLSAANPHLTNAAISVMLGEQWKALPAARRARYVEEARRIKEEFQAANPEYRYARVTRKGKKRKAEAEAELRRQQQEHLQRQMAERELRRGGGLSGANLWLGAGPHAAAAAAALGVTPAAGYAATPPEVQRARELLGAATGGLPAAVGGLPTGLLAAQANLPYTGLPPGSGGAGSGGAAAAADPALLQHMLLQQYGRAGHAAAAAPPPATAGAASSAGMSLHALALAGAQLGGAADERAAPPPPDLASLPLPEAVAAAHAPAAGAAAAAHGMPLQGILAPPSTTAAGGGADDATLAHLTAVVEPDGPGEGMPRSNSLSMLSAAAGAVAP